MSTVKKQKYTANESNLAGLRGTTLRCAGGSQHGKTMTLAKDISGTRIEVLVPTGGVGISRDGQPMWGAASRSEFYKAVYVTAPYGSLGGVILGEHILALGGTSERQIIESYLKLGLPAADFGPERLTVGRLFDVSSTAIKSIRFSNVALPSTTEIETTSGGIYQYRGASLDDVLDFLSASSKGRHYNNVWKPKYGHTSVKVEV